MAPHTQRAPGQWGHLCGVCPYLCKVAEGCVACLSLCGQDSRPRPGLLRAAHVPSDRSTIKRRPCCGIPLPSLSLVPWGGLWDSLSSVTGPVTLGGPLLASSTASLWYARHMNWTGPPAWPCEREQVSCCFCFELEIVLQSGVLGTIADGACELWDHPQFLGWHVWSLRPWPWCPV